MKAYHLTGPGLENLSRTDIPVPKPAAGDVLVRMHAASLNYIDLAVATGAFPAPNFPLIPVADGAGEVVAVGAGVERFKAGDRVLPHFLPEWQAGVIPPVDQRPMRGITLPGSMADYIALPAQALLPAPDHLTYAEAATLSIAGTTAWQALKMGGVRPGSTVLLLGTGGVSLFALQLAKIYGARVIILSSSDEKLAKAKALGADDGINYRKVEAWDEAVLEMTGGRGADLVVETVGAATFARSVNAAAHDGTVFVVGFMAGDMLNLSLFPVILKRLHLVGSNTGSVSDFGELLQAVTVNRLRPVLDRTFGFDELSDAFDLMARGGHFGKIAVTI